MNTRKTPIIVIMSIILILNCHLNQESSFNKQKNLIEKYVEYWNTGHFEEIDKILHPEFELRMTPKFEPEKGIDIFKENVLKWRQAYPDFHIEIHEIINEYNKAAAKWTIKATNTGQGWHPPTGKHVEVIGISVLHFVDGKIKDEWIASNNLYWLLQLGYTLKPPSKEK
jgi:predicted ester cyclase